MVEFSPLAAYIAYSGMMEVSQLGESFQLRSGRLLTNTALVCLRPCHH